MMEMFRVSEYSRYLFLEFLERLSLIIVANQGCYDLHIFRLTNLLLPGGDSKLKLQREFVFKCSNNTNERILGVAVHQDGFRRARIYILTSFLKYHVLEVSRRKERTN